MVNPLLVLLPALAPVPDPAGPLLDLVVAPVLALLAVAVLAGIAELLHARRVRKLAALAFGPGGKPALWVSAVPALRVVALSALAWGLATLLLVEPKHYALGREEVRREGDYRHALLVLDVSPSMRLVDAGPTKTESRLHRVRDLLESFFDRVPIEEFRISVIAVYNGAKPVVVDTKDFDVVRNILGDLPMHYAFPAGKTKLFDGLEEAAKLAKPWNPRSTTVVVLTDGDTVPASGMPRMPDSVRSVLVVGVGDARTGKFIDGRQSRQDVPTLRQIAARLSGAYHDGNEKQLPSALVLDATGIEAEDVFEKLSRREYALIASIAGAAILGALPMLLQAFGTRWRPGRSRSRAESGTRAQSRRERTAAAT